MKQITIIEYDFAIINYLLKYFMIISSCNMRKTMVQKISNKIILIIL